MSNLLKPMRIFLKLVRKILTSFVFLQTLIGSRKIVNIRGLLQSDDFRFASVTNFFAQSIARINNDF
jgi:hypothetical protein